MHKKQFLVLIERDEDGMLVGTVPALKGCHTQAKTLPTLLERIKEAIQLCLERVAIFTFAMLTAALR